MASNLTPRIALMRLAVATRETLDAGVYDVYLEHLAGFPEFVIIDACHRLASTANWFPKVAELVRMCNTVQDETIRQERLALLEPRRPALPMSEFEAATTQRRGELMRDKFLADLRQLTRKRVMR